MKTIYKTFAAAGIFAMSIALGVPAYATPASAVEYTPTCTGVDVEFIAGTWNEDMFPVYYFHKLDEQDVPIIEPTATVPHGEVSTISLPKEDGMLKFAVTYHQGGTDFTGPNGNQPPALLAFDWTTWEKPEGCPPGEEEEQGGDEGGDQNEKPGWMNKKPNKYNHGWKNNHGPSNSGGDTDDTEDNTATPIEDTDDNTPMEGSLPVTGSSNIPELLIYGGSLGLMGVATSAAAYWWRLRRSQLFVA